MDTKELKVTRDGFIWKIVNDEAKDLFDSGLFPLYVLQKDDSESWVTEVQDITDALNKGLDIGIEVGNLPESKGKWVGVEIDLFDTTQKVLIGLGVEGGDFVEHCNTEDIKINPENPWVSYAEFYVKDEDERVFDDKHQLIK